LQEEIRLDALIGYLARAIYVFTSGWLDVVWIPVAAMAVHTGQRLKAVAFVVLCMIVMRLQIEIVESTGFRKGFTGLLDSSLYHRGLVTYGIFITIYLLLSYFSPYTKGVIYLAASISIFFMAFLVSSIVMII
jgi:hypothetical protein